MTKTLIYTSILLAYLYFIISPKEPFKLFPSLMFVFILIAIPIYYLFVMKSHQVVGKIAVPLLSSFVGLFLALYVNGYYNYKKDSEVYKLVLINTHLEIGYNLSVIKQMEEGLKNSTSQKPINALTNSVITGTLQNPIFLKRTNSVDLILLSFINKGIITCINHLDTMNIDEKDFDKNLSIFSNNLSIIKGAMIQFIGGNKETYNRFIGELTKSDLQKLENGNVKIDFNFKY